MLGIPSWCVCMNLLLLSIYLFYKYFNRRMDYWKKRGVPFIEPKPFIGNLGTVVTLKEPLIIWLKNLHDSIDEPYFGIYLFNKPCLVLKCPKLIQQVFVTEFSKFSSRTAPPVSYDEILSEFLIMKRNPKWQIMRNKLAPIFTMGKLKAMFTCIDKIGENLVAHISKYYPGEAESKDLCSLFSLDVVSQCAFGLDAGLFREKEKPLFWELAGEPFQFNLSTAFPQFLGLFAPNLLDFLKIDIVSSKFKNYFVSIIMEAIKARENSAMKGNDMIDILIDLKKKAQVRGELNFDGRKVSAPALEFLLAGYETTSTTISFLLYELAMNPVIQDELRLEIMDTYEKAGRFTYDGICKMSYLHMCISESLRKYPVLPFFDRLCHEDYQIPGTDIVIEKGQYVFVSSMGLHYDAKYYSDPDKFDPERFSPGIDMNSHGIRYMPFGQGPRMCIGDRFGLLATKIAICHLLSNFVIEKTENTPPSINFEIKTIIVKSDVGLPLRFRRFTTNKE